MTKTVQPMAQTPNRTGYSDGGSLLNPFYITDFGNQTAGKDTAPKHGDQGIEAAYAPQASITKSPRDASVGGSHKDADAALQRLKTDAAQTMDGTHRAEFLQEINGFIDRANIKDLSPDEVARTLEATAKLLEGQGEKPLSQTDRIWLANSLMHYVNQCDRIDQGFHNTCNVTAISKVVLSDDPARYAEMVSSAALNSYYESDGKRIALDAKSLEPDREAQGGETANAKRNYATQIFDLVAINNFWQRREPPFSYVQRQSTGAGDTGERLLNSYGQAIKDSNGHYVDQPGLDCRAMAAIGRELDIKDTFLIANEATHPGDGVAVGSEQQLQSTLMKVLHEGHPAVLFVHSGNKLFTGKYGLGGGGWHVVTVDGYDPTSGKFHLANQWGKDNDQMVSLADLYDATLPPEKWAKCPGYFNKQIFDAHLQQQADGGAGLEPDGVMKSGDFNRMIEDEKQRMRQQEDEQLSELLSQLKAARDRGDEAEVHRLEDWIQRTRVGLRQ